ncbi:EamA family transporter [Dactylosporangium sp. NPDC005572]|uniref:EamA family transporter n=1 Tax=Dactylosporangium sp. NPDC005572 TaxID=3156889 RepID=UPI0033B8BD82
MPVTALLAVLLAAVLHASWNAVVHALEDRLVGFVLIGTGYTVCAAGIVLASPAPARASWPFIAVSAVLQVAYNLLLMRCYQLGDFSQVYPISRGTSPWLVAVGAAVFAGEVLAPAQAAGLVVISAGLGCLMFAGGRPGRAQLPAIAAALLTGVTIAAYTTVDGLGVRQAHTTAGYTGWLFLLQGPVLPLAALVARGRKLWVQVRPHLTTGLIGGVLSLTAYALVLWAQTRGALGPVAALRETSIIVGAAIGALVFHERFGRWRVTAAVLITAGVVLMSL